MTTPTPEEILRKEIAKEAAQRARLEAELVKARLRLQDLRSRQQSGSARPPPRPFGIDHDSSEGFDVA